MRIHRSLVALALIGLVGCTNQPKGDLVIRQRTNAGGAGGHARDVTIYVQGGKRVDDFERVRKIVDLDAKTITMVYKQKKTYTQRTFDQLNTQAEEVQKHLDGLPQQARDLIATLAGKGAPLTLTPTGKTDKIAGFDAKEYTVEGGVAKGTVWATDALEVPREGRDWKVLTTSLGGFQTPDQQLAQAMAKMNAFPVRTELTTEIGKQQVTLVTETLEVKREAVPPEIMKVPDGFEKVEVKKLAGDKDE